MNHWAVETEVKPSTIHGFGRFSLSDVRKDEVVLVVMGDIKHRKTCKEKMPIRGTDFVIDCEQTFINHRSPGNLYLDGQIVFRASRDINPGEELTIDYRTLTNGTLPFKDVSDAT